MVPLKTRNDMSLAVRTRMAALLNDRLADAIDLQLQAKQAHWNVKGPQFISLHELFDQVADTAIASADLIAERLVALGGRAEGTLQSVAGRTTLTPYTLTLLDGSDHVKELAGAIAAAGRGTRAAIDQADEAGDQGTSDLFTQITRDLDKMLWFVEAHVQASH
ncbi:MAG: DNA starvation/stationary phase protection protein Dps [Vicinamibacterales bacterium]